MAARLHIPLFLMIVLVALAAPSAAYASSATGEASVTIVSPLSIEKVRDLSFGAISVGESGGTVRIRDDGRKEYTGDVTDQGGDARTAEFTIRGARDAAYTIDLPDDIRVYNGPHDMHVNSFETSKSGDDGKLDDRGRDSFEVGARLVVEGDQPPGVYTGSFQVAIHYQ